MKYNLESGGMIPKQNQIWQPTIQCMEWLSFSNYGKITELNKYFKQFKNSEHATTQLYPKMSDEKIRQLQSQCSGNIMYPYQKYTDNSNQHIQNWLSDNKLIFDEIKSAEFYLNKWIEISKYELVDVQIHSDVNYNDKMHKNIGLYECSDNPSNFSQILPGTLFGYFRAANPRKKENVCNHKNN